MDFENFDTTLNTRLALPIGRFAGHDAFEQLVRDALVCAAREGWKELILSDATFEDWPLRERAVVESLQIWSKPGRRMTLLATRYDEVLRHHARFVSWRKTWGHLVDCRVCCLTAQGQFPSVIWSSGWFMQRLDGLQSSGFCGNDKLTGRQVRELIDENLRTSTSGFPVSVLGL